MSNRINSVTGGTRFADTDNRQHALTKGKAKPFEDFIICFGITFAVSVMSYEHYIPESIMRIYLPFVFLIFLFTWIWSLLINGHRKNIIFPVMTTVFWLLPALLTLLTESGPKFIRFSLFALLWSDFAGLIVYYPISVISGFLKTSEPISAVIIWVICLLLYLCGFCTQKNWAKLKTIYKSKS